MKNLLNNTAFATSLGFAVLTAAAAHAYEGEKDKSEEMVSEVTVAAPEGSVAETVTSIRTAEDPEDVNTVPETVAATVEALEEVDITDKDESNLTAETQAEIDALNGIISILIDAEEIYSQAADMPDDNEDVRMILADLAVERENQTIALQKRVRALGGEPDEFGEAVGTTHRAFAQLRTIVDNDTEVAIEEVLRGERYIVDEIGKLLTGDITPEGELILETLRNEVYLDIQRLEDIDDAA